MNTIKFGGCPFCGSQSCVAGQCQSKSNQALLRALKEYLTSDLVDVELNPRKRIAIEAIAEAEKQEQSVSVSTECVGEPVAIVHRNEYNEYRLEPHDNFDIKSIPFNVDVSLFKSPQRKPWVSLSDEDIERIAKKARSKDHAITLAMRELKEKNA